MQKAIPLLISLSALPSYLFANPLPQSLSLDLTASTTPEVATTNTTANDPPTLNCVTPQTPNYDHWTREGWLIEDCYAAIGQLYRGDVLHGDNKLKTFSPRAESPRPYREGVVVTPRKYEVGTCSISLITLGSALQQLLMSELPGIQGSGSGWPFTDTERFKRIYDSLKALEHSCAAAGRVPGWVQLGQSEALGVFIWAKDSQMDRLFPAIDPFLDVVTNITASENANVEPTMVE